MNAADGAHPPPWPPGGVSFAGRTAVNGTVDPSVGAQVIEEYALTCPRLLQDDTVVGGHDPPSGPRTMGGRPYSPRTVCRIWSTTGGMRPSGSQVGSYAVSPSPAMWKRARSWRSVSRSCATVSPSGAA